MSGSWKGQALAALLKASTIAWQLEMGYIEDAKENLRNSRGRTLYETVKLHLLSQGIKEARPLFMMVEAENDFYEQLEKNKYTG